MMFKVNEKVPSRSTAKTTLERGDDDPQGVFFISNKQKVRKSRGVSFFNKIFLVFIAWMLVSSSQVFAASGYPVLEKLVKQQKYSLAYELATKIRSQNEGDPRFDYLYGLSALQSGHPNEAVFALDRVTVATPNVIRPRLELARAYLSLNNTFAAKKEFNDVLNLNPPPMVRKKVLSYLAELDKKSDKLTQRSVSKSLASLSFGYDDNINFGYDNSEIDLPDFGVVSLDDSSVKQGSGFAEAKFQFKHRTLKNKVTNTFFTANATHRDYFKNSDFNLTDLDLRTGLTFNHAKKQYQLVGRTRPILLDGKMYSNTIGIDVIARKSIGSSKIGSVKLSIEKYDNKKVSLSDRSRAILSGRIDKQSGDTQHQLNLYLGKEWPDKSEGKQYSRDISGVGYWAVKEWNKKNRSYLGLDYRHYKHQKAYAVYPDKRKDDRVTFKIGHEYRFNDELALITQVKHINNRSNLDLYDAKRNEVKVGIRYDWD